MHPLLAIFATTLATLFPITNPFGNAAIFLSITDGATLAERRRLALKGSIYMFAILIAFLFGGTLIMNFFGFTLEGVRIAGGLVIVKIGFDLLAPKVEHTHSPDEHAEAKAKEDIAFSPLAMPLLSGPGAIAAVIGISANLPIHSFKYLGVVSLAILLVCAAAWLILRESDRLLKMLGVNGANALTKIMGFLLLCMGVQLVISGVTALKFA